MDAKTVKLAGRAAREGRKAKREKIKEKNRMTGAELKTFWADGAKSGAVLAHNGVVFMLWAALMLAVAYAALQADFIVIALVLGETGGILMETSIDVITTYVVIALCTGFVLFFSFAIEKYLIRCMSRRFWRLDKAGHRIDKGELWHEKHPVQDFDPDTESVG